MRAKFKLDTMDKHDDYCNVTMHAITEQDGDNEEFWKYTPAGQLQMTITNPAAYDKLELGQTYYLDFTKAS